MTRSVFVLVLIPCLFLDRCRARRHRRPPVGALAYLTLRIAGLVGLTILALNSDVQAQPTKPTANLSPAAERGPAGPVGVADLVKIYKENCGFCHGGDGTGNRARKSSPHIPDFTSLAWQMSQTDLEIAHQIRDGHEPLMPAFQDDLNTPQILALTIYVRGFSTRPLVSSKVTEPGTPAAEAPKNAQATPAETSARMTSTELYRAYCLACHDAGGRGATVRKLMPEVPDFSDPRWHESRSDAEMQRSILEGKGKLMLPMKDKLGRADAERMVAFLRAFRDGRQVVEVEPRKRPAPLAARPAVVAVPPSPNAPSAETVARLRVVTGYYRQYCLTCHGVDGRGTEMREGMPTLPDFASRTWQEGNPDEPLAASVLDGKGAWMPSFRGRVSAEQAHDLIAHVRAFGPPRIGDAGAPRSDPDSRFHQLQQQWEELDKQIQALSSPRRER